jgi:hypothetical protein
MRGLKGDALRSTIEQTNRAKNKIRDFLGGRLKAGLLAQLRRAQKSGAHVYVSTGELRDPEILPALAEYGERAHISSRNGGWLHKSVIVFTEPDEPDNPVSVWLQSGDLTSHGICCQSNHALFIDDPRPARRFLDEWRGTSELKSHARDSQRRTAERAIDNAQEGILFLASGVTNPWPLFERLFKVMRDPAGADLLVHGLLHRTARRNLPPSVTFVHRNHRSSAASVDVMVPAVVPMTPGMGKQQSDAALSVNEWASSVRRYAERRAEGVSGLLPRSNVLLVDPFGKHPAIIIGGWGGARAGGQSDQPFTLDNDAATARQYAVYIMMIYNQYRWRFQQIEAAKKGRTIGGWNGLMAPWHGQASYRRGGRKVELSFWT